MIHLLIFNSGAKVCHGQIVTRILLAQPLIQQPIQSESLFKAIQI